MVTPFSLTTSASRGTFIGGWAIKKAITQIKSRMIDVAAELLKASKETITFENGQVYSTDNPDSKISFKKLVSVCYDRQMNLSAVGWYYVTGIDWDPSKGKGAAYKTYTYSANVAEIELNKETGVVKVKKIWAVHDCGRVINPVAAKSQVTGGISWAVGYALYEDFILENGVPKTLNFDKYHLTRALEMPDVEVYFIQNPDPNGPYGAKSIAEPSLEPGSSAISNAIFNATGLRFYKLPIKKEHILEKLKKSKV